MATDWNVNWGQYCQQSRSADSTENSPICRWWKQRNAKYWQTVVKNVFRVSWWSERWSGNSKHCCQSCQSLQSFVQQQADQLLQHQEDHVRQHQPGEQQRVQWVEWRDRRSEQWSQQISWAPQPPGEATFPPEWDVRQQWHQCNVQCQWLQSR